MDPDAIYQRLIEAGDDWADKNAAADTLEKNRDSVKARLMMLSSQTSMAGKEMEALADDSYSDYIAQAVAARKAATKAKVKYDSIQAWIEIKRSVESTKRAEMNLR